MGSAGNTPRDTHTDTQRQQTTRTRPRTHLHRLAPVVVPADGVGGGDDGGAGRQGAHDACLGDGDALLLHGLQQRLVLLPHLVELVDAAHALVTEDQRPRLQGVVAGRAVFHQRLQRGGTAGQGRAGKGRVGQGSTQHASRSTPPRAQVSVTCAGAVPTRAHGPPHPCHRHPTPRRTTVSPVVDVVLPHTYTPLGASAETP